MSSIHSSPAGTSPSAAGKPERTLTLVLARYRCVTRLCDSLLHWMSTRHGAFTSRGAARPTRGSCAISDCI